jgi:protein O-mannosyl-transferase
MIRSTSRRFPQLAIVGVLVVLACVLYVPFLKNPFIFDDVTLFSGGGFAHFATLPSGVNLRHLPYFSLAFPQIMWGRFPPWGHPEIHRLISLAFHVACSLALYRLLRDLLLVAGATSGPRSDDPQANARLLAFIGAAVFAIHPVAVYGTGYLIQRTIVLATLFSLLSMMYFVRGLSRGSHADAISAALFYTLAVLSKEHSVLLPAAAVLAAPLVDVNRRFAARHAALYLAACAPAAILVTLLSKGLIGDAYEPSFEGIADQLEGVFGLDISDFPWALSAVTQAGLFFQYLALWVWPDTRGMSIDLRVDFIATWTPGWIFVKVSVFAAYGAVGILLLRRRGRAGLVGLGLLYTWILFLVEFTTVRFQEPLVLYRSFLWAPGILIALAAALSGVSRRVALAAFAIICPVLLYQAHDRLVTFSSPFLLWQDAVAKLPGQPIPWGSRTLYNLGREYLYSGRPEKAAEIAERCLAQYPHTYHCHFARGAIHLELRQYEQALSHIERARALRPASAVAHNHLGLILENLGRREEARAFFRRASELGFGAADHHIQRLDATGGEPEPAK